MEIKNKSDDLVSSLYTLQLENELGKVKLGWMLLFSKEKGEYLLCKNTGKFTPKYSNPEFQWRWSSDEPIPDNEEITSQVREIIEKWLY